MVETNDGFEIAQEDLLRRGRVDTSGVTPLAQPVSRDGRATHALVREGREVRLIRRLFHEQLA